MSRKYPECEIDFKVLARPLEFAWGGARLPKMKFWDGKYSNPVTKNYKISICTTCMDRLKDLKVTLPQNIKDNLEYPNVEFVVIDYGSKIDDIGGWIKSEMMEYIEKGILVFIRTDEPKYFEMGHSRNIAFQAASGDIVNNVDADGFTNRGFVIYINKLANQLSEKVIFAKSRQLLRGRQGYYKKEFIDLLGGYNEDLRHYGSDDVDLMNRAWELGFTMMSFQKGGNFSRGTSDHKKHQEGNYPEAWWQSEGRNRFISYSNLLLGRFKANEEKVWGKAKLVKNFTEEIETGIQG